MASVPFRTLAWSPLSFLLTLHHDANGDFPGDRREAICPFRELGGCGTGTDIRGLPD
jgi:hypothetical protein